MTLTQFAGYALTVIIFIGLEVMGRRHRKRMSALFDEVMKSNAERVASNQEVIASLAVNSALMSELLRLESGDRRTVFISKGGSA